MAEAWGWWGELLGPFPEAGEEEGGWETGWGSVLQFQAVLGPLLHEMSMEGRERQLWRLLGLGWGCLGGSPSVRAAKSSWGEERKGRDMELASLQGNATVVVGGRGARVALG